MEAFLQLDDAQRFHFDYQLKVLEDLNRQKDEKITKLMLELDIKNRTVNALVKQVVDLQQEVRQLQGNGFQTGDASSAEGRESKRARSTLEVDTRSEWQINYDRYFTLKVTNSMDTKRIKQLYPDLHEWATEQRAILNGKSSTQLTAEQQKQLIVLGIRRDYRSRTGRQHIPWNERFKDLKSYVDKHGHTRVTLREDPALSNWVSTMRKAYKRNGEHSLPLTPTRFQKLQSLGFEWEVKAAGNNETWEMRFNELCQYKAEHGSAYVPRSANSKLNAWCKNQRKKMKEISEGKPRGLLTEERVARLESIDFPWDLEISTFGGLTV
jgi:hypothetical protein